MQVGIGVRVVLLCSLLVVSTVSSVECRANLKQEFLRDYVENVIIHRYVEFKAKAERLNQSLADLAELSSTSTLDQAKSSWVAARAAWESGEAHAFGPAKTLGLDGAIDSWPLNRSDLEKILADPEVPLTSETMMSLDPSLKGFHAIEFLLFGENGTKGIHELTVRERKFLKALGEDLHQSARVLLEAWTQGLDGAPPFGHVLESAGEPENTIYPDVRSAFQEILGAWVEAVGEVAYSKLQKPLDTKSEDWIESRFSQKGADDFVSNICGSWENYGRITSTESSGRVTLSVLVERGNLDLNQRLHSAFQEACQNTGIIPSPFNQVIQDAHQRKVIQDAIDAIHRLVVLLDGDLRAFLIQ
jgi:putative iron-regulated protein